MVHTHKYINVIQHTNRIKDKNHIIISIDAEKAFDKIQHVFTIKTMKKLGTEEIHFSIIKQTYSKHHTKWGNTETTSSKVRNEAIVSAFPTLIQYIIGMLRAIRQEK
jgi:hypothetical protein